VFPNVEVRHLHAVIALGEELNFTKAFQVGSRDLIDVYESPGRGPREELLLEDRGQLIESRVGQILVALAVQKT